MTITSISQEIGADREVVLQRIDEMVRMGYLKEVTTDPSCSTSKCVGCPMKRSCGDSSTSPIILEMTSKGERILNGK